MSRYIPKYLGDIQYTCPVRQDSNGKSTLLSNRKGIYYKTRWWSSSAFWDFPTSYQKIPANRAFSVHLGCPKVLVFFHHWGCLAVRVCISLIEISGTQLVPGDTMALKQHQRCIVKIIGNKNHIFSHQQYDICMTCLLDWVAFSKLWTLSVKNPTTLGRWFFASRLSPLQWTNVSWGRLRQCFFQNSRISFIIITSTNPNNALLLWVDIPQD